MENLGANVEYDTDDIPRDYSEIKGDDEFPEYSRYSEALVKNEADTYIYGATIRPNTNMPHVGITMADGTRWITQLGCESWMIEGDGDYYNYRLASLVKSKDELYIPLETLASVFDCETSVIYTDNEELYCEGHLNFDKKVFVVIISEKFVEDTKTINPEFLIGSFCDAYNKNDAESVKKHCTEEFYNKLMSEDIFGAEKISAEYVSGETYDIINMMNRNHDGNTKMFGCYMVYETAEKKVVYLTIFTLKVQDDGSYLISDCVKTDADMTFLFQRGRKLW